MSFRKIAIVVTTLVFIAFLAQVVFVDDKDLIDRRLQDLAQLVTDMDGNNVIKSASQLNELTNYFTFPLELQHTLERNLKRTITIPDLQSLKEIFFSIRMSKQVGRVSFPDTTIVVSNNSASSQGLARVDFKNQKSQNTYDLYQTTIDWLKSDGEWRIKRLEIVRISE